MKKTFEQYCLDYHNSQKTKKSVWWDMYSNKGLDDQQMEGEDDPKEDI